MAEVTSEGLPAVRVVGVDKTFGEAVALESIDLDIARGAFFSLLGPSGSGKTTLLRMIAGFEEPTRGAILLDGVDVTGRPPFDRDVFRCGPRSASATAPATDRKFVGQLACSRSPITSSSSVLRR